MPQLLALARSSRTVAPIACAHGSNSVLDLWAAGLLPATHRAYTKHLTRFAWYLGLSLDELPGALLSPVRAPAYAAVRRYRGHLLARGLAPSTVNVALAAVRSLVGVARESGLIDWSLDVASVRVTSYTDTRGCTGVTLVALLERAAAQRSQWRAARDVCVIRLLYDLALRCHELTSLRVSDLEYDAEGPVAVWVLGKGHRQRARLTLPPESRAALTRWLAARPGAQTGASVEDDRLLGLGNRGAANVLERLAEKAGTGHVHPHQLRHAAITAALDAGHSVLHVRAYSRHKRLETLLTYDDNRTRGAEGVAVSVASTLVPP